MKSPIRLALIVFSMVLSFFYSCQKDSSENKAGINKPHMATIYLTDHQTPVFDSVFIDLQRLEVKLEDDSSPDVGWVNLSIRPGVYNILRFRNGLDTLFATGNLPNTRLKKIKLVLGTQNSVMKNGQPFPLTLKSEDREVIAKIDNSLFDITDSGLVLFWIDFDAGNSI